MKILVIARYIRSRTDYSKSQINGLKKVLGDIYYSASIIGSKFFIPLDFSSRKKENSDSLKFISQKRYHLIFYNSFSVLLKCARLILSNIKHLREIKGLVVRELKYGYIVRKIELIQPDIVHVHDLLSDLQSSLISYCLCNNIVCILTLHIYYGKKTELRDGLKPQEICNKTFLLPNIDKLHISCVSSNQVRRLLADYPNIARKQVSTILNGTDFSIVENSLDIDDVNLIGNARKVILCIGKFIELKNQFQILRAIELMKKTERDKFIVLFIGEADIKIKNEFDEYCLMNDIQDSAQFIGPVSISEIHRYYAQSDFVISASINEAFGLTFIEGFVYGLPVITFSDLDAIDDLYDEKVMVLAKDRTDDSLKNAILSALNKQWDKEYIKKYARKFSVENMVNGYNNLYFKVLKGKY
nr:glycosyltransferase family 4 protein [uncultured Draconibacterium sp.]